MAPLAGPLGRGLWLGWFPLLQDPFLALDPLSLLPCILLCPSLSSHGAESKDCPWDHPPSSLISSTLSLLHQGDVRDALLSLGEGDPCPQSVDDASKPRPDGGFFFLLESSAEAASSAGSEDRDAGHGNHLGPHTKMGWRFPQAVLTISATSLVSPRVLRSPLTLPAQALFWGEPPVSYLIWLAFWG